MSKDNIRVEGKIQGGEKAMNDASGNSRPRKHRGKKREDEIARVIEVDTSQKTRRRQDEEDGTRKKKTTTTTSFSAGAL